MMHAFTTGQLFAMRQAVIFWTSLMVAPFEFVFDSIDDALEMKGHHVRSYGPPEEE
jgi:hypothetical protein